MVNEEYNPIFAQDQNTYPDGNIYYPMNGQVVLGQNNNIDPKASFISVQGNDNFVGPDCTYISLVNSSGVTVSASNYTRINNLDIDARSIVRVLEAELSSADLLTLNSVPYELLPAPGAGFAYEVISAMANYVFGTVAYDSLTGLCVGNNNLTTQYGQFQAYIASPGAGPSMIFKFMNDLNFTQEIFENEPLYFAQTSLDSTVGDGTLKIYLTYRIVTL
jgi:hypothetical protein